MRIYRKEAYGIQFTVLEQKILPPKSYDAMNLLGFLWVRSIEDLSDNILRHEAIHTLQLRELWYLPYYIWYGLEFVIRLLKYRNWDKAYRNICFEQEAYANSKNLNFRTEKEKFSFLKYMA